MKDRSLSSKKTVQFLPLPDQFMPTFWTIHSLISRAFILDSIQESEPVEDDVDRTVKIRLLGILMFRGNDSSRSFARFGSRKRA